MKAWSIDGTQNLTATTEITMLGLTSSTSATPSIHYFSANLEGATTAGTVIVILRRYTAPGTGTTVTPQNLGPNTLAPFSTAKETHTVEPTYTAGSELFNMGINSRDSLDIILDRQSWLHIPASTNNGIGMAIVAEAALVTEAMSGTMHFRE